MPYIWGMKNNNNNKMTYTFKNTKEVVDMINNKVDEVWGLVQEGHMPEQEGRKMVVSFKQVRNKIRMGQYDIQRLPKEHPDLFISQTMLYHPDNYDVMNNLIEMLGIR